MTDCAICKSKNKEETKYFCSRCEGVITDMCGLSVLKQSEVLSYWFRNRVLEHAVEIRVKRGHID